MKWRLLLIPLLLAGCEGIPKDPDGTLERVRTENSFTTGLIAGPTSDAARLRQFLERIQRRAGARASIETGSAEELLARLEAGQLDMVVGAMNAKSPWKAQVHFLPPLRRSTGGQRDIDLIAMARNGENAWIRLLHREALAVGQDQ